MTRPIVALRSGNTLAYVEGRPRGDAKQWRVTVPGFGKVTFTNNGIGWQNARLALIIAGPDYV